ncbi:MAG: glycosyl transferase [Candidatus Omnitrophica bacterium CG11_big_fil_rev_8_21_14_0_20_45_26]|uniref:Glycosyl transferase n=1 Tax=Candidatus Abzuiibacterium crystallinum TaxID=1974748 RepID=A0A2H0LKZ2_9BACT|nr:MAG: glycosyl transferase [Candidatus Omnitrophica bacterium CG11_big_fil_rev_8_21_14_0_20_45_26]PIW63842.1 MAG: glycosyl transferase [Candidatus Omnitrophica bacterium CG12_big_fil_rev_8_21_14_0_65_45_16]
MLPLVSVIIPTYNRLPLLKRAVRSVQAQTYHPIELIIVDDGSIDETSQWAQTIFGVIYVPQTRQGVSRARNHGLQLAKGDWIAFLDSDDEWLPKKIQRQIEYVQTHPQSLIVQTEEIWIRNGKRVNPMKKHKKYGGNIFEKCLPLCIVSPSAAMIKRSLWDEVGLFDESLPACEDYDLWLRIAVRHPIDLIPEPLIIKYGGHADQLSHTTPALDGLRIKSIIKLIQSYKLSEKQTKAAWQTLREKCRIYGEGCLKHGKITEGKYYLDEVWEKSPDLSPYPGHDQTRQV